MPDEEKLNRLEEMVEAVLKFDTDTAEGQRHVRAMCGRIFRLGHAHGWDEHVTVVQQRERDEDEANASRQMINGKQRLVVWSKEQDAGDLLNSLRGVYLDDNTYVPFVLDGWGGGVQGKHFETKQEAKDDTVRLWSKLYGGKP